MEGVSEREIEKRGKSEKVKAAVDGGWNLAPKQKTTGGPTGLTPKCKRVENSR